MNESRACAVIVDFLEIDCEFARIMLGKCENFGAKKCDDMITDHARLGVCKIRVFDPEHCVEPVDLVRYEGWWNKALQAVSWIRSSKSRTCAATMDST